MVVPYKHEPLTDFSLPENQQAFLEGLKKVESYLGQDYDLVVGGKRIKTEDKIVSINPANKEEVIGRVSKADKKIVDEAMNVALEAFEKWRKFKPEMRAEILFKAAAIVRRRKCGHPTTHHSCQQPQCCTEYRTEAMGVPANTKRLVLIK